MTRTRSPRRHGAALAALVVPGLLAASPAGAQGRPSTTDMTCARAAGLVRRAGGIVLGTGGFTYDRFVAQRGFCEPTEVTKPAFVPTRDTPSCPVGYRCIEPSRDDLWD